MRARASLLTALCALALSACALGAHSPQTQLSAASTAPSGWRASDDELAMQMRAIAQQLGTAGLTPDRQEFRGFLTTGARTTHRFNLPARGCATLIAIASRGVHDMDAALYSPEGDVLAVDTQPDAHPTMQVCNGDEARTIYYALQVYEGAGSFVIGMFTGEQAMLERAAKVLGARPTIARLGHGDADDSGRVAAFREGLQRRGFEPLQAPMQVQLANDQDIRVAMPVKPGQCYTAAGFALDGLRDVDLRVLNDEGGEIARDQSREEDASAQFCADRGAEYAAVLHGVQGSGTALLLLFEAEAASIGGQSGLWLGERPLSNASNVALDDALMSVTQRSARDGFLRPKTLREGRLGPGEAIGERFALPAQRCARIHAVGGPGVRRLSLAAKDSAGRTITTAEGDALTTYVHVCSAAPLELDLQVLAAEGTGPFALAAYETALSSLAPTGASDQVRADLAQAAQRARDAGYEPLTEYGGGPLKVTLAAREQVSLPVTVGHARCLRAYLLTTEPSARAQLWVAGTPVDAPTPEGEAVRFCGDKASANQPVELRVWSNAKQQDDAWLLLLGR